MKAIDWLFKKLLSNAEERYQQDYLADSNWDFDDE